VGIRHLARRDRHRELARIKEESMPFLLRAAIVGGAAYHVGKRVQGGRDQDAAQQQQIDQLQAQQAQEQQQYQQAPPAQPAMTQEDGMAKLTQLKSLLDQGVLTQAEFDAQKSKILASM
jgi:membrane protease subunit (stomatin/prohibitin family)